MADGTRRPYTRHVLPRRQLDTDVYTLALERTAYIMQHFDNVAVAFSGGKDSTAVLNVALEVAHSDRRFERHLPLRAVHFDEEAIPFETEQYVRRVAQRDDVNLEWYCLPVQHRNACSRQHPYWWPWAPEDKAKWCRPLPPEALTELPGFPAWPQEARLSIPDANGLLCDPAHGNTAMLMGIRAAESLIRARAVTLHSTDNYIIKYAGVTDRGNIWKTYPVYDWTTTDVWTAPALKGWDYNPAYDRMEMAGVSKTDQRCSPAFGEEPIGKLHIFAECFPEVWAQMCDRVPGAAAAARYARTELWGYGGRPGKPADMTWPEFLQHYLTLHPPKVARQIAVDRLGTMLRTHYKWSGQPVVPKTPHPDTGLSWEFLLGIAMRGDFKERKQPTHRTAPRSKPDARRRMWHRYAAELAALAAAGVTPAELGHPRPLPADPWTLIPAEFKEPPE